MAIITICVDKEDIQTTTIGLHYQIKTREGLVINFTPEAVDEFIADVESIRNSASKDTEQ